MDEAMIRRLPAKVGAGDATLYKGGTYDGPHHDTDEYQLPPEYHDGYWMPWADWVAFAEAIIEADKAAREPEPRVTDAMVRAFGDAFYGDLTQWGYGTRARAEIERDVKAALAAALREMTR